ncbi:MAG TPA: OmpA family protein [Halomicronema sp.]
MALSEENQMLHREDTEMLVSVPATSPDSHSVDLEILVNLLLGIESPQPAPATTETDEASTSFLYDDNSNGRAYNEETSENLLEIPETLYSLEESANTEQINTEIDRDWGEIDEAENSSQQSLELRVQENLNHSPQAPQETIENPQDLQINYQPDLSSLDDILERWHNRLMHLKTEDKKSQQNEQENHNIVSKKAKDISADEASILLLGGILESASNNNKSREILDTYNGGENNLQSNLQEIIVDSQLAGKTEKLNFFADNEEQNQNNEIDNYSEDNVSENPLEQLQTLLLGSQMSELDELKKLIEETGLPEMRQMIQSLGNKLETLECKLTDSKQLINLLVPWIAEILSLKVAESKEEVIKALVPIIDDVIRQKTQQDAHSMSAVIGALLPSAISQEISQSPKQIAKAIGPEIGAAIREQIRIDRDEIISTLAPEMGRAIKGQIELERDAMVDALYPVIGNTIAKYLSEAIRAINQKVENAFSMEGMQRKMRAKMQGVSEAELILQESIPFTAQAVFLIHKASGLVISEVQRADSEKLESEMVAGMLTAIRSFVNDCIVKSGEISELNQIEYGDSKIILEVAGYCYLALIQKGEAPKEFIETMRDTLAKIIVSYEKIIEQFDGDTSIIPEALEARLALLMGIELKEKKKPKAPTTLIAIGLAILTAIFVPWGISEHRRSIEQQIQAKTATALASTPELAVYRLNVNTEGGVVKLSGNLPNEKMRAKAEQIAQLNVGELKLKNEIRAVEVPPDPVLMEEEVKRLTSVFNQINGVEISAQVKDQKVSVWGTVMQMTDAEKIASGFANIPGVKAVVSTVKLNPLNISSRIYFDSGSATVNPSYEKNLKEIKEFLNQYPQKYLKIIGHSDRTGNKAANQRVAVLRATAVRDALVKQGVDPKRLQIFGNGNPPADVESHQPLLLSRCVVFEPITKDVQK